MDADQIRDYIDLFLAMAAAVVVVATFIRWSSKKRDEHVAQEAREFEERVLDAIEKSTKQIRTDGNGGQSLNDLHLKVDGLLENQQSLLKDVELLKSAVLQLEDDMDGMK